MPKFLHIFTLALAVITCTSSFAQSQKSYFEMAAELSLTKPWTFSDTKFVSKVGTLELRIPPKKAMHLFTAIGEKYWIPDWNPNLIKGDGFNKGDIFSDPMGTFYVVDFNVEKQRIFYVYISPIDTSSIELQFKSDGQNGSIVIVHWTTASLSKEGSGLVESFDQKAMNDRMKRWGKLIVEHQSQVDAYLDTLSIE